MYFAVLGGTLLLEVPTVYLMLRRRLPPDMTLPRLRLLLAAFGATLFTHPFIHFVFLRGMHITGWKFHLLGEIFAYIVETIIFYVILRPRPARWAIYSSFAANTLSYVCGLIVFKLII